MGLIDLHCHKVPGINDGAPDLEAPLARARCPGEERIEVVACTPDLFSRLYGNAGPQIRKVIAALQSGRTLSLGDICHALFEPSHHAAPLRPPPAVVGS